MSSWPKKGGHFENVKILNTASIWHQKWKDVSKLCEKKYFHCDDVINDVTGWPQKSSIYSIINKNNLFGDNWRTNKDIILKLSVHMQHGILNTPLQTIADCSIDYVIRSQNKSKLWTAIPLSIFELEKRSKAQNVGKWTGFQKIKFKFHIQISKFLQVRNFRLPFHLALEQTPKNSTFCMWWDYCVRSEFSLKIEIQREIHLVVRRFLVIK